MSIFKITIKPIIKERGWEVTYVVVSRKEKICDVCGRHHPIGDVGTTFTKFVSTGYKNKFIIYHTCGHNKSPCTIAMAKKLNIKL